MNSNKRSDLQEARHLEALMRAARARDAARTPAERAARAARSAEIDATIARNLEALRRA